MGLIILVADIVLLVFLGIYGYSSKTRQTTVRKIDPTTGQETVEIHEDNSQDSLKKAARITFWVLLILTILIVVLVVAVILFALGHI